MRVVLYFDLFRLALQGNGFTPYWAYFGYFVIFEWRKRQVFVAAKEVKPETQGKNKFVVLAYARA